MNAPYRCSSVVSTESVEARRVVIEFASTTYREQRSTWDALKAAGRRSIPRPPTWEECLAKSLETRRRREVNDTESGRQVARHDNL